MGWDCGPHVGGHYPGFKTQLRYKQILVSVNVEIIWTLDVIPFRHVGSVTFEDLDARVFSIGNIDRATTINGDGVRESELSRAAARFTPRKLQRARG